MSRADATAMNRLSQWLAGEGAAKINYRGLMPADIDELALAACASPTFQPFNFSTFQLA